MFRERLALVTALFFFGGPAIALLVLIVGLIRIADMKEITEIWASYFGAPAGAVFGYYFGSSVQARRRESELNGRIRTIEEFLERDVSWSEIEAATGINEAAFRKLKHLDAIGD